MNESFEVGRIFRDPDILSAIEKGHELDTYGPLLLSMEKEGRLVSPYRNKFLDVTKKRALEEIFHRNALATIDQIFEEEKIPLIHLGELAIGHRYYKDPLQRNVNELEFLIRPEDADKVWGLLRTIGARSIESKQGATVYKFGRSQICFQTKLFEIEDREDIFVSQSRPSTIPGISWMTELSAELGLIRHATESVMNKMGENIFWLIDLDYIIEKETHLNWEIIRQLAAHYKVENALGAALAVLNRHMNSSVPAEIIDHQPGSELINLFFSRLVTPDRIIANKRSKIIRAMSSLLRKDSSAPSFTL